MASTDPEPEDKEAFIQAQLYDYHYKAALPGSYNWPKL
jgi:malate dehydrogenase (oxaloacetate-decarboxylating)(NADP+)